MAMNIAKLISMCDELKPNQYDTEQKTQWLSEIEATVIDEILNQAEGNEIKFEGYDYNIDSGKELLVPDAYADLYLNYLMAKIDYFNAEYGRYNNSMTMFNLSYDRFAAYYIRNHMPKQKSSFPKCF